MAIKTCACCGKIIDTVRDGYTMCRDNFIQANYFEEQDGSDNVFCSQSCACENMMIEHVFDEAEVEDCECDCESCFNSRYDLIDSQYICNLELGYKSKECAEHYRNGNL